MTSNFQCPQCHGIHEWPEYVIGKQVKCPACRQAFVAREAVRAAGGAAEPAEPPLVVPAKPPPDEPSMVLPAEPLTVEPVEEFEYSPPRSAQRLRRENREERIAFAQTIKDMCDRRDLQRLSEPRRRVFALLVTSLEILRPNIFVSVLTLVLLVPFVVLVAFGIGLGLMFGIWLAGHMLTQVGIPQGYHLLYLPPGFVILTAYYSKKWAKTEPIVLGKNDKGEVDRIQLGMLESIFRISKPATALFFLGVLFSLQVGLLYFLPGNLEVAQNGTFLECLLLTTDNLCHGVFLDTFELYDIHLAASVTHNWWTASVFYLFRISFEAFALIAAYQLWRHYAMRRLFRALPRHWRNVDFVLEWIEQASRSEGDWAREFLDEFLFLVLAGAYLSGDDEMVRDVDRRFPWLRIREEVRRLFMDDNGERLFEFQPEPD